jgi:hypothetical protein
MGIYMSVHFLFTSLTSNLITGTLFLEAIP